MKILITMLMMTGSFAMAQEGVWVYAKNKYRGVSELFTHDDSNLKDNIIGNDSINSLRVPAGCTVILYEHTKFRGRQLRLTHGVHNLNKTSFGNDRASSLRITWSHAGAGAVRRGETRRLPAYREPAYREAAVAPAGVTLFEDNGYRGRSATFYTDIPDLRRTPLGNDQASSLKISPGYEVVLYEDVNYGGCTEVFRSDDPRLRDNLIGNDSVSSLRVRCVDPGPGPGRRDRVPVLYDRYDFSGRAIQLEGEIANLKYTSLGNDRLSSLEVPPGYLVTLYADVNFRGAAETFRHGDPDLADNWIGDNRASSAKVVWLGRR